MRCKCCDAILSGDRAVKLRNNGQLEDLCSYCVGMAYNNSYDKDYYHSALSGDDITILFNKLDGILA